MMGRATLLSFVVFLMCNTEFGLPMLSSPETTQISVEGFDASQRASKTSCTSFEGLSPGCRLGNHIHVAYTGRKSRLQSNRKRRKRQHATLWRPSSRIVQAEFAASPHLASHNLATTALLPHHMLLAAQYSALTAPFSHYSELE